MKNAVVRGSGGMKYTDIFEKIGSGIRSKREKVLTER
jgi:hypothetical protein